MMFSRVLIEAMRHPNGMICDDCGTECVNNCLQCGAPQCCPKCCDEATAEFLKDKP
jgi:hypothetical protein